MKIYISLDMEGVVGTFDWMQEEKDKQVVRECVTRQMEWVLEGIKRSKKNEEIEEILIADSHGRGDNLLYNISELDDRIYLVSGYPRPQYMMPALEASYDMVFFIGYHAGAGAMHGSMDHTYASRRVHTMWMNELPMNEALVNAAYAGYYDIPVTLIIGDAALEKEIMQPSQMPWVKYVSTKDSLSKFSAKLKPVAKVKEETIQAVIKAIESDYKSTPRFVFPTPTTLKIEFQTTAMADVAALMPGTKRLDGRAIEFVHPDYKVLFDGIMALVTLASTVNA